MKPLQPGEVFLVTANRLLDGRIVWCDEQERWCDSIRAAVQMTAKEAQAVLERRLLQMQQDGVVGVYEVVARAEHMPEPVTMRERIRAFGPSVHPHFAYGETA